MTVKYRIVFKGNDDTTETRVIEAWTIVNDGKVFLVRDATSQSNTIFMIPADRLISAERINGS